MIDSQTIQQYFSQHRWLAYTLQIILVLIVIAMISMWQTRHAIRGVAPALTVRDINNTIRDLQSYRGRPVLIHFWATWCPVCSLQHSTLNAINEDYQLITIASWSGTADEVQHYLTQHALQFPVVVDTSGELAKRYGVQGTPTSFVLDQAGIIQFVEQGYTTEWGLRIRLWWLKYK